MTPDQRPAAPILSVQPGGGFCYQVELLWGRLRRRWLKQFRPGFVEKMAAARKGDLDGAPHEILDPRDLKYCSNQCTAYWEAKDDPFRWRDRLPVVRWGLAELQIMGWPLVAATAGLASLGGWGIAAAAAPASALALIVYFFRDPQRVPPDESNAIVSPADGTISEIVELEHYDFVDGPAVRVSIFLSIFNVHVNRAPWDGKVVEMDYRPGEFINAMNPESAERNEAMWVGMEAPDQSGRNFAIRQVSGLIARRIVCALKPGQTVRRGEKFGMIKLGSRTELILPRDAVTVEASVGEKVKAGVTVLARFA